MESGGKVARAAETATFLMSPSERAYYRCRTNGPRGRVGRGTGRRDVFGRGSRWRGAGMDGWIMDGWGDPSLRTDWLLRGVHEAETRGAIRGR